MALRLYWSTMKQCKAPCVLPGTLTLTRIESRNGAEFFESTAVGPFIYLNLTVVSVDSVMNCICIRHLLSAACAEVDEWTSSRLHGSWRVDNRGRSRHISVVNQALPIIPLSSHTVRICDFKHWTRALEYFNKDRRYEMDEVRHSYLT